MMVSIKFYSQFQFVFILVLVKLNHAFVYGPSLEFLTSLENPSMQRRTINLADYAPTYSVVVPLAVNKSTAEPDIVRPVGEFNVEAPQKMRIMAIIQSLHLRTKSVTSAFPPVCRDFIRFGESINKICGDVQKNDKKGSPLELMGARTFLSTSNYLNVTVFTDGSSFVETWMKKPNVVEISFTAYQSCPFYDPDEVMLNCLNNIIPYGPSCISANLTCDGTIQCGFLTDGTFSKDETNCPLSPDLVPTTLPTTTSTTTQSSKTGFPSWWDWENSQGRANVFDNKIPNIPSIYIENDKTELNPTTTFTQTKTSFNPFNYVGIFIVVLGISIFIKIVKCLCQEYSTSNSTTTSTVSLDTNFSHVSPSVTSAPLTSIQGSPLNQHRPGRLDGVTPGHYVTVPLPVPIYDHDSPPPPYHSLFPNTTNS